MKSSFENVSSGLVVDVVRQFVHKSSYAETYEEVFAALATVLADTFRLRNCQIFEALASKKELFCVYELKEGARIAPQENHVSYNVGFVGEVAAEQFSRVERAQVIRVCSPILFHGELLGVICSTTDASVPFPDELLEVFDLLAEISASLLVRIRQKNELDFLRSQLERHLEDKKVALEVAIETVSNQFSEIKFQRDKKEYLLREVHHRVNNNLQILSSIVNLSLKHGEPTADTFVEIHRRIQNLSSIHLILLKSLELSYISVQGFIEDLISAHRNQALDRHLTIDFEHDQHIETLSMDTLVPLGMLLHELIVATAGLFDGAASMLSLRFDLRKKGDHEAHFRVLSGDVSQRFLPFQHDGLQAVLIEALCDQLDGSFLPNEGEELWNFRFALD